MLARLALWLLLAGDDPTRVDPDRPTITNTTATVPRGAVQVEVGVDAQVYGRARDDDFLVAVPMIVRIGVHDKVEIRVFDGDPVRWAMGQTGARQLGVEPEHALAGDRDRDRQIVAGEVS